MEIDVENFKELVLKVIQEKGAVKSNYDGLHFSLSAHQNCSFAKLGIWYLFTFTHLHLKVPPRFSRH